MEAPPKTVCCMETASFSRGFRFVFLDYAHERDFSCSTRYQSGLVLVYLTSWIIRYILLPHFDVRYSPPQALVLGIIATAGFGIKGSSDIRDGEYPTTGVTECHEVEVTA